MRKFCVLLQHEASVGVLLMDETGSVGLDLSFVSQNFVSPTFVCCCSMRQVWGCC